uniref:Putative secreted protein n=1 Tax=Ixodes ricinus TaxID=34613 RepID=A0A090XEQ2_IXORI
MTPHQTWFLLLIVSVLINMIDANSRTRERPAVCNQPPQMPSRVLNFGYEVFYFNKKEAKCKCFRSTVSSKDLGGNAFHGLKACRNKCGGASFSVCPRRGGKR